MPYAVQTLGGDIGPAEQAEAARAMVDMLLGLEPRPVYASVMFLTDAYDGRRLGVAEDPVSDTGIPILNLARVADRAVPDGYWWQMLGEPHRDRLGGWPDGTELLDHGARGVVTFGRPDEWADPETRTTPQAAARAALGPLVVHDLDDVLAVRR
jgi:hypothetical protein